MGIKHCVLCRGGILIKSIMGVLAAGLVLVGLASPALAGKNDQKGSMTLRNVSIPGCGTVESVTAKYSIGAFMGEPTVNGAFKWNAGSESVQRCINYSTSIYLRIQGPNGHSGYIKVSPTVPKSGQDYGMNTTGSPNWNKFICDSGGNNCLSANDAKDFIKSGYSVAGFRVHTSDIPKAKAKSQSRGSSTSSSSGLTSSAPKSNVSTVVPSSAITRLSTTTSSTKKYEPQPTLKRNQFATGNLNTDPKTLRKAPGSVNDSKKRSLPTTTTTRSTTANRYASKPQTSSNRSGSASNSHRSSSRATTTRSTASNRYTSKPQTSSNQSSSRRKCPNGQPRC